MATIFEDREFHHWYDRESGRTFEDLQFRKCLFVIPREKALLGTWRQLNLRKTYWPVALQWFLNSGEADIVLVAPKRDLKYRNLLEGLQVLRDAGVANPD